MLDEKILNDLVADVAECLMEKGVMLVTAESCTGGLIGAYCTEMAGSSAWFYGGIISYANEAKMSGLGVSAATLEQEGAVSEATIREMCAGALQFGGDVAIAVSGVAGPSGGTAEKPVGCVWIGWQLTGRDAKVERCQFTGTRSDIRQATVAHALTQLLTLMK